MSFKIIQEFGKPGFIIIPEGLEKNGVFWLPPLSWSTKVRYNLMRNKFFLPDKSSWEAKPCVVKKSRIDSYEIAEEQEELLLDNNSIGSIKSRPDNIIVLGSDESIKEESKHSISELSELSKRQSSSADHDLGRTSAEKSNDSRPSKILSKILKSQQQHQNEVSKQLTELKNLIQDKLGAIFIELQTLTQVEDSDSLSSIYPDIYPQKFCIKNFTKISTCEEANLFEKMLMISEFRNDMVDKMSITIGSNGTRIGEGLDCCYNLIEIVFQRKFLKMCSWTGASTSQMEDAKITFLKYKNIISFFASVILNADPDFSFERTKEFFKEVLHTDSEFLNPPNNRDQNQEQSPNNTNEEDNNDQQHQSRKSNKRNREEDNTSQLSKRNKLEKSVDDKFDRLLLLANRALHNALDDYHKLDNMVFKEEKGRIEG